MTRSELIQALADDFPHLTGADVEFAVRILIDRLSQTIASGGRVEIRGFGSFSINYQPARRGRNPKTGVAVEIPAKYVPRFKPGRELRQRVDRRQPG